VLTKALAPVYAANDDCSFIRTSSNLRLEAPGAQATFTTTQVQNDGGMCSASSSNDVTCNYDTANAGNYCGFSKMKQDAEPMIQDEELISLVAYGLLLQTANVPRIVRHSGGR
jgi:hypothetical protein